MLCQDSSRSEMSSDVIVHNNLVCCSADINECIRGTNGGCPPHSKCQNTIGGYNCDCDPGYEHHGRPCFGQLPLDLTYIIYTASQKNIFHPILFDDNWKMNRLQ